MSKTGDHKEEKIFAVDEALSKSEHFIEKNQKIIMIVIGAIVVIVLGYIGYKKLYIGPKEKEAQGQMFMAQKYFEMDSLNLALNGDGNYLGFLSIIDDYGITKSGNLSHYYAGICYLKKGEFENAIEQLKKFDSDDEFLTSLSYGGIGDAYTELGDNDNALKYYLKAAQNKENDFTSAQFYLKAGFIYEDMKQFDKAIEQYEKIKKDFFRSYEARDIDKYIERAKGMSGSK
ncbi:MAG: tetratricopeptide repeat protein [Bacteroidota bacterium]